MDPVQPQISLIYTTNNDKNLAPKVCSKKIFKSTFRVSSQISIDLYIYVYGHLRSRTFAYVVVTIRTFFKGTYANVPYAIASSKFLDASSTVMQAAHRFGARNVFRGHKLGSFPRSRAV